MTASFAENSNKKDDNMQDSIKNKLNALVMRNEDITRELASPGVVNDQKRFRDLMKEQNELAPIVEAFTDYSAQQQNVADSIEMMDGETDPEMKEMLREEIEGV